MAFTSGAGVASEQPKVPLPKGGSISAKLEGGMLELSIHARPDLVRQMRLAIDATVAETAEPELMTVAELEAGVVILEDTYASRKGGLSFCQSGREQFLRVLDLRPGGGETLRVKLRSCVQSIELDDGGVAWNGEGQRLTIHWLVNIGETSAEYDITNDGDVRLIRGE